MLFHEFSLTHRISSQRTLLKFIRYKSTFYSLASLELLQPTTLFTFTPQLITGQTPDFLYLIVQQCLQSCFAQPPPTFVIIINIILPRRWMLSVVNHPETGTHVAVAHVFCPSVYIWRKIRGFMYAGMLHLTLFKEV